MKSRAYSKTRSRDTLKKVGWFQEEYEACSVSVLVHEHWRDRRYGVHLYSVFVDIVGAIVMLLGLPHRY